MDEKTWAQKGKMTCPRSHSTLGAEVEIQLARNLLAFTYKTLSRDASSQTGKIFNWWQKSIQHILGKPDRGITHTQKKTIDKYLLRI